MRTLGLLFLAGAAIAQAPTFQPVASVSQIMLAMTYPYSDALLYIERKPPATDNEWNALQNQALMLAESGNLLMMPGRAPATRTSGCRMPSCWWKPGSPRSKPFGLKTCRPLSA